MVSIWNRLPTDLRQKLSLDGFVRELNSFYYLKFQNTFSCDTVALGQVLVDVRRVRDIWRKLFAMLPKNDGGFSCVDTHVLAGESQQSNSE